MIYHTPIMNHMRVVISIKILKNCASLYVSKYHLYMLEEIFFNFYNMYAIMM